MCAGAWWCGSGVSVVPHSQYRYLTDRAVPGGVVVFDPRDAGCDEGGVAGCYGWWVIVVVVVVVRSDQAIVHACWALGK